MFYYVFISERIINDYKNNETNYLDLPKMMYKERRKNVISPLTSTKIRSKSLTFHKLRKNFTERLHLIFNRIKNK